MVEGLYDIVSDKVVGVNLLMAQVDVTFPVVIHFTQPLQAILAGFRPRPAGRESAASKAGDFVSGCCSGATTSEQDATAPISAGTLEKKPLRKLQIAHLREVACAYIPIIEMTGCEGKESD